jgi:branched-chain amino acid transport system permease protein
LRDEYLALTTFAFAEVFHSILQNTREVSNGTLGIAGVERPFEELFRPDSYRWIFAGLVLLFLLASFLLAQRLGRSPFGRTLMAIRDDELSVGMAGRNVRRYRLQIFVLTAVMAGFAGAFYAWYTTAIHPDVFLADITFVVFIALIIGGVGSNRGAIIGAFVLISFEEFIRFLALDPSLEYRVSGLRVAMTGLLMAFLLRVRPREGEGPLGEWLARLDWGPLGRKKRRLDVLDTDAR